jgi:flagellar biosynthesis chaperone FliJ
MDTSASSHTPPVAEATGVTGAAPADGTVTPEVQQMRDMKLTVMDSAELATRAAGLSAQAGIDLRKASDHMTASLRKQNKMVMILLGSGGGLMLIAAIVFVVMSVRLQSRVSQLDAMVLAVGKRVVEMDASMEMVGSVQEALKEVVTKQGAIAAMQTKIDARLDEVIKSAAGVPELTAKQVDGKTQVMTKQVQSLDGRLQAQANSLKQLATQMQGLQGALVDAGAARKELEALTRQQRERQASEGAASAAAATAARNRERMLQYPRVPPAEKP